MLEARSIIKILKVFSITGKYLKLVYSPVYDIERIKKSWAQEIVSLFNINITIVGKPKATEGPCLLVGNHISYLDIPILLYSNPEISFVSKSEIKSWPIIGKAAVKIRTIFVDRQSHNSRNITKNKIATALTENNQKVVIFPSGTTAIRTSSFWKKGAFEIAEKNQIMLQPFRLTYDPLGPSSYVGKDNFLIHMYQLFRFKKINVTLVFHEPVAINDCIQDCIYWKNWCEQ